ncbi:MAG: 2-dehydro-3-deoxygalactonokinase [Clostridia bacterium]|nr:2-dehydro-3-deoxygalactonokinase [Clostridia bacterium]
MANYITVDSGTTNTRLRLVCDGKILDTVTFPVGARVGADDLRPIEEALRHGIQQLLERNALTEDAIHRILASGMITCEVGLHPLPHLVAPAGIRELHAGMDECHLPTISPIPFVFLRGIRTEGDSINDVDMMRGEETELMGLNGVHPCVYILPGSHSKIVQTDAEGRIVSFRTSLTGEMLYALSGYTILKKSIDLSQDTFALDDLLAGFDCCRAIGLNQALFKARIRDTLFQKSPCQLYSFFLGVVLAPEIESILATKVTRVVIGGKKQLREAIDALLKHRSHLEAVCLSEEEIDACVSRGAIRIFEFQES